MDTCARSAPRPNKSPRQGRHADFEVVRTRCAGLRLFVFFARMGKCGRCGFWTAAPDGAGCRHCALHDPIGRDPRDEDAPLPYLRRAEAPRLVGYWMRGGGSTDSYKDAVGSEECRGEARRVAFGPTKKTRFIRDGKEWRGEHGPRYSWCVWDPFARKFAVRWHVRDGEALQPCAMHQEYVDAESLASERLRSSRPRYEQVAPIAEVARPVVRPSTATARPYAHPRNGRIVVR